MKMRATLLAVALLIPSAALAAPGMVTATVSLRAGPGDGFPVVDRIPGGSKVNIHGCLKGDAWCDVSWSDDRGWVSSDELQWLYRNNYVYLSDYYDSIDVPVVPFVLGTYWSSYYASRPFFHRRAYFTNYWRSHASVAMRTPDRIVRARTAHAGGAVVEGRRGVDARAAVDSRTRANIARDDRLNRARPAETARVRGTETGRMAHIDRSDRNVTRGPQPMARMQRPNVAAAPAARPAPRIAQPNINHAPPMNARAQMPAPRAAAPAAMPRAAGGGGGGAAVHAGGGAPGGGAPGRNR